MIYMKRVYFSLARLYSVGVLQSPISVRERPIFIGRISNCISIIQILTLNSGGGGGGQQLLTPFLVRSTTVRSSLNNQKGKVCSQ